jgi:hypothetical protein
VSRFAVIIPRLPGHIHSHALDEVAETVHYGLLHLGHDSMLHPSADVLQDTSRRHILIGAHLLGEKLAYAPSDAIIYNLEQHTSPQVRDAAANFKNFTLWDYSTTNVEFWKAEGLNAIHVPIGYVPKLTRILKPEEQDIDVLFYGWMNDRRQHVIDELRDRGLKVVTVHNVYGNERDAFIACAKVVLNMHYRTPGIFEIARVSYLLANKKCVVSEEGLGDGMFRGAVVRSSYATLGNACENAVASPAVRAYFERGGFDVMSSIEERSILQRTLGASL